MKIRKRKRWWGRQLRADLVLWSLLLGFLNIYGGLVRVDNDVMSNSLNPGDLAYIQKLGAKYASGDIFYACDPAKNCDFWRIIAEGDDELEISGSGLFINLEERKDELNTEDYAALKDFALMGGLLAMQDKSGRIARVEETGILGRVIILLRIRDF